MEREKILVDNLLACFNIYQNAIVWTMTASLAFFFLTLRLRDPSQPKVSLLYTEVSLITAWFIALTLFFVLGGFSLTALHRAEAILNKLNPSTDLREAIFLYPSLATNQNFLVRVGSVLLCPVAIVTSIFIEFWRDFNRVGWRLKDQSWETFGGLLLLLFIIIVLYSELTSQVWKPFGSR